jgi:cystathionine beta-lyase/cystathionine gamma-synthase
MHLVDPGQRVVLIADVYGVYHDLESTNPRHRFTYVPAEEFDENLADHLDEDVAMVWVETPSNPLLNVDIRASRGHPQRQRSGGRQHLRHAVPPAAARLSADVVLHSTTKYLGGHST